MPWTALSHVNKTKFNPTYFSISQEWLSFWLSAMACFASSVRRMGKMVSLNPVADLVPPGLSNIKRRKSINLIMPILRGLLLNRANRHAGLALIELGLLLYVGNHNKTYARVSLWCAENRRNLQIFFVTVIFVRQLLVIDRSEHSQPWVEYQHIVLEKTAKMAKNVPKNKNFPVHLSPNIRVQI